MEEVLIKVARLYDGVSSGITRDAFVTVCGNKISAIGKQTELGISAPENYTRVIDLGDDATLLPGLINMHTHMSFSGNRSSISRCHSRYRSH